MYCSFTSISSYVLESSGRRNYLEKRRSPEEEEEEQRARKEKRRGRKRRRGKLLKTTNSNRQAQSSYFYSCNFSYIQCCGSGSMDSHWFWSPGSKSRWAKKTQKNKNVKELVLVAWIQIQVGKKTQKKKNVKEFIDLMCWTCMFSFEGNFSYIQ